MGGYWEMMTTGYRGRRERIKIIPIAFLCAFCIAVCCTAYPGVAMAGSEFKLYGEEKLESDQTSGQNRKYKVFCHLKTRTIIFENVARQGWRKEGKKELAGPFPTGREAILWSRNHCPSGLCTADGKCRRKNTR